MIRPACWGRAVTLICLLWAGISDSFSQLTATGNLEEYISTKIVALPSSGTNVYEDPSPEEMQAWESAFKTLLQGNISQSQDLFAAIQYSLIIYSDTESEKDYFIIEKEGSSQNHWGLYILNPSPCRENLIIQSPHPKFDTNTGYQGLYTFLELESRAYFLSGTHRCNSGVNSPCSGSTGACGSSGPYKISDPAHNSSGIFQLMTALFLEDNKESIFIQFHGFGKQSGDPNAILSNGTRLTPQNDHISKLVDEMTVDEPTLSFKVGHLDLSWDRLLAFTNTQGRMINGSDLPCTSASTTGNGQFIHIEQELSLFRSSKSGWSKWVGPMSRTFPCDGEVLSAGETQGNLFTVFPNPVKSFVSFSLPSVAKRITILNTVGQQVACFESGLWKEIDLSDLVMGTYIYHISDGYGKRLFTGKLIKSQ